MKTARKASMEGAVIGKVLTIVRGERSLSIPARELPDLVHLLQELAGMSAAALPTTTAPSRAPQPVASVPSAASSAAPSPAPTARPSQARRGRVWEGVKRLITNNGNAPVAFSALLKMVKTEALTDRNAEHALKIALGKKVRTGELVQKGSRYILGGDAAPAKQRATSKVVPARPAPKRKHRPGELWRNMRAHLVAHPEGQTQDELVAAASAGNWTPARDPKHAVKICLSRVGDQIAERDGRTFLADAGAVQAAPAAAPALSPTVRKRKKVRPEEPAPAMVETAQATPTPAVEDENDPHFEASQHYPTPRSRLPR